MAEYVEIQENIELNKKLNEKTSLNLVKYTEDLEQTVCSWINKNILNKNIQSYDDLANAFYLTELMAKIDKDRFDTRELWALKKDATEAQSDHFGWNNLEVYEKNIRSCWLTFDEQQRDIFTKIPIDFTKIFQEKDRQVIQDLIVVTVLTIILLSGKNTSAMGLIENIIEVPEKYVDTSRAFIRDCVEHFTNLFPSEYTKKDTLVKSITQNSIMMDSDFGYGKEDINDLVSSRMSLNTGKLLTQIDRQEIEINKVKEENRIKTIQIDTLSNKNEELSEELDMKTERVEKLCFQLDDFKKKANVGLLDYQELECKQKDSTISDLNFQIQKIEQEYEINTRDLKNQIDLHKKECKDKNYFEKQYYDTQQRIEDFITKDKEEKTTNIDESFKLSSDLELERQKFNNLQEMAIKDKERCVEIELKYTEKEFELQKKNIQINQLNLDYAELNNQKEIIEEKVRDLTLSIKVEKQKPVTEEPGKSNVGNTQKLNSLNNDVVEYINKFVHNNDEISKNNDLLQMLNETSETMRKMREDVVRSESEVNERNNALRSENEKLRKELKRSKERNDNMGNKLKETQAELEKREDSDLKEVMRKGSTEHTKVAQDLLKKVIDYENQMKDQIYEREMLVDENIAIERNCIDNMNMVYSIVVENYAASCDITRKPSFSKKNSTEIDKKAHTSNKKGGKNLIA